MKQPVNDGRPLVQTARGTSVATRMERSCMMAGRQDKKSTDPRFHIYIIEVRPPP